MHPIVLIAFVLSGFTSLTLQTIWIRYLELVFGATTLAVSTVLTCFMGGLALGSWLFGRYADRLKSPVVTYGIVEGIEGLCAFVIPLVIQHVYPFINLLINQHLSNNFLLFSLARFVAVAVLLAIPTTCMGATLPLLARHVMRTPTHMNAVGQRIGLLYTVNTVGAVLGVFGTTFFLLKSIGLWATNVMAGVVCLLVFVLIYANRRRIEAYTEAPIESEENGIEPAVPIAADSVSGDASTEMTPMVRRIVIFAFFAGGLASMNLQVVWNRILAMVIGSSVYSFGLVLMAFLIGLTSGSALFTRLSARITHPVRVLGLVQIGIAVAVMLSYAYLDSLPRLFAQLVTTSVTNYENHVGLIQFIMFIVAALPVFPVTFGMGATFPLTMKAISASLQHIGRDVGSVYALNTVGAICGSFLSAFVFVPLFSRYAGGAGMQVTYFVSMGIYFAVGLAVFLAAPFPRPAFRHKTIVTTGLVLVTLLFIWMVPSWDPARLTVGVFRFSLMKGTLDRESWGDPDIRYYYDGVTTTVSIDMWGRHISLKNNGKVDASNGDDMPTQIMVAAIPLLMHPDGPDDLDVAIVGFGSGVTVGSALQFPVRHVDCVELEAAVVEASAVFGVKEGSPADPEFNVNHLVYRKNSSPRYDWTDPDTYVIEDRLTIVANDGRNFLASSPSGYDVIISQPSNPWITGVSNMFTRDSFRSSARALKPNGIFGQWIQLYEMSPDNIRVILRTFADVFPYVVVFSAEDLSADTILVGSFTPVSFDLERVDAILSNPRIHQELNRAYVFSATDVAARVLMSSRNELLHYTDGLPEMAGRPRPINTDNNAHIEFAAPRDLISYRRYQGYLATLYAESWPFGRMETLMTGMGSEVDRGQNAARLAWSLLMNGRKREARVLVADARTLAPSDITGKTVERMLRLLDGEEIPLRPHAEILKPLLRHPITSAETPLFAPLKEVQQLLDRQAILPALHRFLSIPAKHRDQGGAPARFLMGYLYYLASLGTDWEYCPEAISVLTDILVESGTFKLTHPEIDFLLGVCHDRILEFDKAVKYTARFVRTQMESESHQQLFQHQEQANLAAALLGESGTALLALPADRPGQPTTDAPGESDKMSIDALPMARNFAPPP